MLLLMLFLGGIFLCLLGLTGLQKVEIFGDPCVARVQLLVLCESLGQLGRGVLHHLGAVLALDLERANLSFTREEDSR